MDLPGSSPCLQSVRKGKMPSYLSKSSEAAKLRESSSVHNDFTSALIFRNSPSDAVYEPSLLFAHVKVVFKDCAIAL